MTTPIDTQAAKRVLEKFFLDDSSRVIYDDWVYYELHLRDTGTMPRDDLDNITVLRTELSRQRQAFRDLLIRKLPDSFQSLGFVLKQRKYAAADVLEKLYNEELHNPPPNDAQAPPAP